MGSISTDGNAFNPFKPESRDGAIHQSGHSSKRQEKCRLNENIFLNMHTSLGFDFAYDCQRFEPECRVHSPQGNQPSALLLGTPAMPLCCTRCEQAARIPDFGLPTQLLCSFDIESVPDALREK